MNTLYLTYQNHNWTTTINTAVGSKTRVYTGPYEKFSDEAFFDTEFPETLDIKITNYCDIGCTFCHESSTKKGTHGDLHWLLNLLDNAELPAGVELAIGGGDPLSHPDLEWFLVECSKRRWIINLTVNERTLEKPGVLVTLTGFFYRGLVYAFGISLTPGFVVTRGNSKLAEFFILLPAGRIVLHIIVGIHQANLTNIFKTLRYGDGASILILGYKEFGFGVTKPKSFSLLGWDDPTNLKNLVVSGSVCFDELAVQQLNLKSFSQFFDEIYYNGPDFSSSMYVDAVTKSLGKTSRDPLGERVQGENLNIQEFFKNGRSASI
jgi:hypothetical protein